MEKYTEKLEESLVKRLKELRDIQTQLLLDLGQIYVESKRIKGLQESLESNYNTISKEFNEKLNDLEAKYPNGEVDLVDGVVIYEK